MKTVTYYVRGFPGAFVECSDRLASGFVLWRWVVSFWKMCRDLRYEYTT